MRTTTSPELGRRRVRVVMLRDCAGYIAGQVLEMSVTDAAMGISAGLCRASDQQVERAMREGEDHRFLAWR